MAEKRSTGDQTRSRSHRASPRGRSGTGSHSQGSSSHSRGSSSHSRGSSNHCRDSSFPAPVFAPAAAPPPAPPVVPRVMTVAQLVQQPGREHLPYLTPFNRFGNGISAWINNMMYSNLSKGYLTFTHFPAEDQEKWFRQFAFTWNPDHTNFIRDAFIHKVMDNYGKQIYEWKQKWLINQTTHTNKHTGEIDDGVVRDVLSLIETQKEDEETVYLSFKPTWTPLRRSVSKKKGRLVGLGRRARSVPPSAPQPYVDPEVLMDQLKDKDDRIAALEQKMADQEAGWEATRKQNEQMMEMMKRMYPNEQFPYHCRESSSHYRDSSFPAPVFAPAAATPPVAATLPVAAPPPAPPVIPGVMTVAQLVQPPGREHLPYLTLCPKGQRQTWFNRSGNGISASINNMMYSNLSKGYPTFSHFPAEEQEMWFRQFAQNFTWNPDHTNFIRDAFVHKVMDNYGKQIYEWKQKWLINQTAHTNKHTGEIDDGVVRDVLSLIETQKEDEETRLSQLQTDLDATSTASTNLSRIRINEIVESSVPKKKGRLVGLGRRARSVPPSAPQPYVDPEVLMDQLKDKDDRIAALEQKMADQEAGWEATRKQNEQMMEMMKRMYPNEQFP
ncbi:hypothetical protein F2Q69_00009373 [Brassica cretica]|uniref:Uncharacterized protein n=1 Tax=Brassica cretica TaxID=69181 RepID=A0A8S9P9T6_BRACR|nr:hypothetical protein F2Q69_00009373 [Brassica cretica]